MQYSEDQIRDFKEEFAKRRRAQMILVAFALVFALVLGLWGEAWSESNQAAFLAAVLVYVVVVVVFAFKNSRCPACGGLINNSWRVRYCPLCGVPLR